MKYTTPKVQAAGVASKLIQSKDPDRTDGGQAGHIVAVSTLLEVK